MLPAAYSQKNTPGLYLIDITATPLPRPGNTGSLCEGMLGSEPKGSSGDDMKHYAIEKWVDFSRGIIAMDQAALMQAHLHSGCAECAELSGFTSKLSNTCTVLATD